MGQNQTKTIILELYNNDQKISVKINTDKNFHELRFILKMNKKQNFVCDGWIITNEKLKINEFYRGKKIEIREINIKHYIHRTEYILTCNKCCKKYLGQINTSEIDLYDINHITPIKYEHKCQGESDNGHPTRI